MTSCALSCAPSLVMARLTWVLTVAGLTTRRMAISSLDRPLATSVTISRSRSVSELSASAAGRSSAPWAERKLAIRLFVAAGDSRLSPRATVLIAASSSAGSAPLPRNPLAPARSDSKT